MSRVSGLLTLLAGWLAVFPVAAQGLWVIDRPVEVSEPVEVGDVIVVSGGSLTVIGVPEPGFRLAGNLFVLGSGVAQLTDSVVRVMSTFHGEFAVAAGEQGRITVSGCDYQVPSGVQHALLAVGEAHLTVRDTDFGFVQFLAGEHGTIRASRLDGVFEVLVQGEAHMVLEDIPRTPGRGELWVWPEFPAGSRAVYTPPLPGYVERWTFPPEGSVGISQSCTMTRCRARLWPLLVRAGSELTLRDIPPENWVVVGLHMPLSGSVVGLRNGASEDGVIGVSDRILRLERASIDTWNLYPQLDARVEVEDSVIGELLAMERGTAVMRRTVVDGTGGYFGANGDSVVEAEDCTFTCDVQASQQATMALRRCRLQPYPGDSTGEWTRFGAYGTARLLLDACSATSRPSGGGQGLIAVTGFLDPPAHPPGLGPPVTLRGWAALFSLDPAVMRGQWRVEAHDVTGGSTLLGAGDCNLEGGTFGTWSGADAQADHELHIVVTDGLGRTLTGKLTVPAMPRRVRPDLTR